LELLWDLLLLCDLREPERCEPFEPERCERLLPLLPERREPER